MSAHAPMATPVAMTMRCMTSTARLTGGSLRRRTNASTTHEVLFTETHGDSRNRALNECSSTQACDTTHIPIKRIDLVS
jgi:hypothetical protein